VTSTEICARIETFLQQTDALKIWDTLRVWAELYDQEKGNLMEASISDSPTELRSYRAKLNQVQNQFRKGIAPAEVFGDIELAEKVYDNFMVSDEPHYIEARMKGEFSLALKSLRSRYTDFIQEPARYPVTVSQLISAAKDANVSYLTLRAHLQFIYRELRGAESPDEVLILSFPGEYPFENTVEILNTVNTFVLRLAALLETPDLRITRIETGSLDITIGATAVPATAGIVLVIKYGYSLLKNWSDVLLARVKTQQNIMAIEAVQKFLEENNLQKGKSKEHIQQLHSELVNATIQTLKFNPTVASHGEKFDALNLLERIEQVEANARILSQNSTEAKQLTEPSSNPPETK